MPMTTILRTEIGLCGGKTSSHDWHFVEMSWQSVIAT